MKSIKKIVLRVGKDFEDNKADYNGPLKLYQKHKSCKHQFLKLPDKIIGIAADQYKGKKVYIYELKYPYTK